MPREAVAAYAHDPIAGSGTRSREQAGRRAASGCLIDRAAQSWQAVVRQSPDDLRSERVQRLPWLKPPPMVLRAGHQASDAYDHSATGYR